MGIYNELVDHTHPALRQLQRQVEYFRIIVMDKRKEYALAADECRRWMAAFPKDRRSYEALGVQYELGKTIIAQLPTLSGTDKDKAVRAATDVLADVVRVVSPFKPDALALLQKYRPNASFNFADASKLNYDEAMAQADQAISLLDYEKAINLLKVAVRKADPVRDPVKANRARYLEAFCFYMTKTVLRGRRPRRVHRPPLSRRRMVGQGHRGGARRADRRLQRLHDREPGLGPRPTRRPGQIHRGDLARDRAGGFRQGPGRPGRPRPRSFTPSRSPPSTPSEPPRRDGSTPRPRAAGPTGSRASRSATGATPRGPTRRSPGRSRS